MLYISVDISFIYYARCEIVFLREELEELQGTIRFSVEPQFQNNSVICPAVKMPYDYKISE